MRREILLVASGIVLSFTILAVGAWVTLQLSPFGQAVAEHSESWYEAGDPFQSLKEISFALYVFVFPLAFVGVAIFVGAFVRRRGLLLALISVLPALGFFLMAGSWSSESIAIGIGYVVLTVIVSLAMASYRNRKIHFSQ